MPAPNSPSADLAFEAVLPRLVTAYESGKLVPFIGAGMSVPTCTPWDEMVYRLEERAMPGVSIERPKEPPKPEELVRRANRAVRLLKAREPAEFLGAMRYALFHTTKGDVPRQTAALAQLWWPLVLTTNYDNFYPAAFRSKFDVRRFEVLGRSALDCQRVLTALGEPANSILWTLQGFLDEPCVVRDSRPRPDLAQQLVVGHDEYRRVTYRDVHFRRAFAEVFRSRSLLFLGSGIRETYVQELFGEVLEMYGPSARPHYAIMQAGEVDPDFMSARFQINVIEYPRGEHGHVGSWLDRFANGVQHSTSRPKRWSWGELPLGLPALEVVHGCLPKRWEPLECLALSAGGRQGNFAFSGSIRDYLRELGVSGRESPQRISGRQYLGKYDQRDIFAVRARSGDDERGLEHIYLASRELFDELSSTYQTVHMQLLAAGGSESAHAGDPTWRARTFPERYSFVQIVRAFADWRRERPDANLRLVLHVLAPPVHMEIASARLRVDELLACADMRFWAEVQTGESELERRLFEVPLTITVADVVKAMNLPIAGWQLDVVPAPNLIQFEDAGFTVEKILDRTMQSLGVVPGSTVLFRRA